MRRPESPHRPNDRTPDGRRLRLRTERWARELQLGDPARAEALYGELAMAKPLGAYLNNQRRVDGDAMLTAADLLHGRWVIARRGKKTVGAVTITEV